MKRMVVKLLVSVLVSSSAPLFAGRAAEAAAVASHAPCNVEIFQQLANVTTCSWSEKQIKLILIPGPDGTDGRPPLLYLLGGPGGRADVHVDHMKLLANRLGRPVLLPDTADSFPTLDCRRTDLDDAQWGVARKAEDAVFYTRALQERRLAACLEQVRLTPDLVRDVSTSSQARRLMELRALLNLPRWVVMAESYGARVALSLAEMDGGHIDRLILDSPETPWVEKFWHTGKNFHEALTRLSELCRDEYLCPALRLHMEERLPEQIALFERDMVEPLALRDLYSRQVVAYARPTREQLLITTFMALRSPERMELMPYIAASNNDETLKKRYGLLLSQLLRPGGSLNVGFHHAVKCSELPLDRWYAALEEDRRALPNIAPFIEYLAWRQKFVCSNLAIPSPHTFEKPAQSNVPTFVLSGGLDPVTPHDVVAQAFPGVTHRTYGPLGHIIHSQRDCVLKDITQFVRDGSLGDTSCSKKDLELKFYTPVMKR